MGNLRPVLIMALVFLAYMMWIEWQKDYGPQTATPSSAETAMPVDDAIPAVPQANVDQEAPDLPSAPGASGDAESETGPAPENTEQGYVEVLTDVLRVKIDPAGGTVVLADLLSYPVNLEQPEVKVELLRPAGNRRFIAQSGLLSQQEAPNHTSRYDVAATQYELSSGDTELRVPLTWRSDSGLTVTKTFVFRPGDYRIEVLHEVVNEGSTAWTGGQYEQLQQSVPVDREKGGLNDPGRYSFFGIGFYDPEDKFKKIDFDDVADEPYSKTTLKGWLAMIQHYFFTAWIPAPDREVTYSTQYLSGAMSPRYIARGVSPAQSVAPGTSATFTGTLYVGPKIQDELPEIAEGLEHTVNYGIFTVFSKPLFWLLEKIHGFVGNWGWAIVILTILIKAAFFKLTEAQYRSTARMRKLQPRIEQLKERYGDDRQRMSQAMMELYKKEKVNPLGGCLPILVQIPIFIALYWVLLESVELRQAPFILWIDNLSEKDPYFILPLLNAVFMFATQKLTPMVGMDPLQQKIMQAMPIAFSIMFAFFPAGLVLYWATNAGLSLAQQYYITRKIAASD